MIDYESYFGLIGLPLPKNEEDILDRLTEEKIVVLKRSRYSITNQGALLFARDLDDFEGIKRKAVRLIVYQGKNKLKTVREQLGRAGYAEGFVSLIDLINHHLPSNEEIGKALRKEVKMYPELAIRELVANALIHQDLTIQGAGPMVEIFSDGVEITNPGAPIISSMRFLDSNPQSRNEKREVSSVHEADEHL